MEILFIKLGALGGVLRATPLFTGIKEKYPLAKLHVLTKENALDLLKGNKDIDLIWIWEKDKERIKEINFDWIINTEDDYEMCSFVMELKKIKLTGPFLDEKKEITYTQDSALFYDMGKISRFGLQKANELKKKNKRAYQNIYCEILGFNKNNYPILLNLNKKQEELTNSFRRENKLSTKDILVGINTGAGTNWPLKSISIDKTVELINGLQKRGLKIVLLGGHNEKERNLEILKKLDTKIIETSTENTLKEYISLINALDLIVTSDTLALHISAALNKRIVSFFGPTSAEEVEIYGNGIKISPNSDCYCCYQKNRVREIMCIDEIKVEDLIEATLNQINFIKK